MEPVDVIVVGQALCDNGFEAYNTISGLGLNTFGMLWPCSDIWAPLDSVFSTPWTGVQTNPTVNTETCSD